MTGLEKIVEQILEEANSQSDIILEEANKKAEQILEAARTEAEKIKAGSDEKLSHEKAGGMAKAQSSADLKKRQAILKAKQEMIQAVIKKAYDGLLDMEADRYFHMMERMIDKAVQPKNGQIRFSKKDLERLPAGYEKQISYIRTCNFRKCQFSTMRFCYV